MKKIFLLVFLLFFSFSSVFAESKAQIIKNLILTKANLENYLDGVKYIKAIDYFVENKASIKKLREVQAKTTSALEQKMITDNKLLLIVKYVKNKIDLELYDNSNNNVKSSESADEYNEKGVSLWNEGKYAQAIIYIDKAIKTNPNKGLYYANKRYCLNELGEYLESLETINKAIILDSTKGNYYNEKGVALIGLGKYDESIKYFDKAIRLGPISESLYANKGYSLYSLGKYQEAIKNYDKAIKLNPNNGNNYYNKGYSLYKLGKYKESLGVIKEGLKVSPNDKNLILAKKELLDTLHNDKQSENEDGYIKFISTNGGYSIYYPSDWQDFSRYMQINIDIVRATETGESFNIIVEKYSSNWDDFEDYYNSVISDLKKANNLENVDIEEVKINGENAKKITYDFGSLNIEQYTFNRDGNAYILTFGKYGEKYNEEFDYILNSFKFE